MLRRSLCVGLLFTLPIATIHAAEWPAWRGPASNAVAPEGAYPTTFDESTRAWKVDLPGVGTSTPTVWGGAIFLTATTDDANLVLCYSLDSGQKQWQVSLPPSPTPKHRDGTGANPSTACDAKHVVAYFKSGELICLTHDGQELWRGNLQEKYLPDTLAWDLGTSPVLTSAGVVVAVVQDKTGYLVTLDLETGQEVWKASREYQRPRESDHAYTTPAVAEVDGRETIVTWGADYLTGHDAKTGELIWECGGFNPRRQGSWRVIASATVHDGVAYVPYGRGDFLAAVKLGGQGDTSKTAWIWDKTRIGADVPCPVVSEGKVYNLNDKGTLTCLDASTGDVAWSERLPRSTSQYYSSPLIAGGLLYCVRQDGQIFVVSVEGGYKLLSTGDLGDETAATPTPIKDGLLMRTRGSLSCYATEPSLYAGQD